MAAYINTMVLRHEDITPDKVRVSEKRQREVDLEFVEQMKISFETVGMLQPIIVNEDYLLVAGAHRLEAAKQLALPNLTAAIVSRELDTDDLAIIETVENAVRRQISPMKLKQLADSYYRPREEALAKKRQFAGLRRGAEPGDDPVSQNLTNGSTGRSEKTVASILGMSSDTLSKVDKLAEWTQDETIAEPVRAQVQKIIDLKVETENNVDGGFKMAQALIEKATSVTPAEEEPAQVKLLREAQGELHRQAQEISLTYMHLTGGEAQWEAKHNRLLEFAAIMPDRVLKDLRDWRRWLTESITFVDELIEAIEDGGRRE